MAWAGAGARPSYWPSGASIICNYGVRETDRDGEREERKVGGLLSTSRNAAVNYGNFVLLSLLVLLLLPLNVATIATKRQQD